MEEYVYTERGQGWARDIVQVTRSGGILIPRADVQLHVAEKPSAIVPAGTPLVRNQRLERQTADKPGDERRTHLVYEEGLHSLERAQIRVQRFEREDGAEMIERRQQMQEIAQDLYVCGQLSFADHERIKEYLSFVRKGFDEFKRAHHKIAVREHIDTANEQQSAAGRFKAMPAAAAAYAARRDVQERLQQTMEIHAAFGTNLLRVRSLLDDIWSRVDAVWRLFNDRRSDRLPSDITCAMDANTRSHSMTRLTSSRFLEQGNELAEIYALPYAPIARATRHAFERLAQGVKSHRVGIVTNAVKQIRTLLRRVRMLWYTEMALIRVLSFPSQSKNGPVYQPHSIKAFNERLEAMMTRVRNMANAEFDPDLRHLVRDHLVAAKTNVESERYEEARQELKRLTRELRVQSLASGIRAA